MASSPATFTWINDSTIQMSTAPANGATVRVYRSTPIDAPLTNFVDGTTLVASDLDANAEQSVYIQQELSDSIVEGSAGAIPNGNRGDVTTSVGGTVWTINASSVTSEKIVNETIVNADINSSAGIVATKLAFTQSGTGAAARTIDAKFKDAISVKDFGAVGNGVADDSDAINAAIAYAFSVGKAVYIPGGRYKVTKTINMEGTYSSSTYPENDVVTSHVFGDGQKATRIEWHGTTSMTTARYPMVYAYNPIYMTGIQFVCPRAFRSVNATFSSIRTPYYGILLTGTFWKSTFIDVSFRFFNVPFSAGIIKRFVAGTKQIEPPTGTSGAGAAPTIDFAQNTFINCEFAASVDEFNDGTFNSASTLNANGTNLARGSNETTAYESQTFSDGSFAIEIGLPQSVINNFIGCQIYQNVPNSLGAIRATNGAKTNWIGCMIVAEGSNKGGFFDYSSSIGASNICTDCYFIGGIAKVTSNPSTSTLELHNCNGEWSSVDNGEIINGVNGVTYSQTLVVDGLQLGSSQAGTVLSAYLGNAAKTTTATGGVISTTRPLISLKRVTRGAVTWYLNGSQWSELPGKATSITVDLASVLRNSATAPESLPASVYSPQIARQNTSTRFIRDGRWLFKSDNGVSNVLAPVFPIDPNSVYNVSVDFWLKLQSGKTVNDLNGDLSFAVFFRSTANPATVVNSGNPQPAVFGIYTGTYGLTRLIDKSVVTIVLNSITPPTDAGYMELRFGGTPNATNVSEIGFGNFRVWNAISPECDPLIISV